MKWKEDKHTGLTYWFTQTQHIMWLPDGIGKRHPESVGQDTFKTQLMQMVPENLIQQ